MKTKEKSKMSITNWLRTKLHNFIFPADEGNSNIPIGAVREREEADIEGLRFTVMPARGGTIVQLRTYDRRKDESNMSTYVIPDGHDVAEEVGRIVSMELIRA
jgi:hypothetical protein